MQSAGPRGPTWARVVRSDRAPGLAGALGWPRPTSVPRKAAFRPRAAISPRRQWASGRAGKKKKRRRCDGSPQAQPPAGEVGRVLARVARTVLRGLQPSSGHPRAVTPLETVHPRNVHPSTGAPSNRCTIERPAASTRITRRPARNRQRATSPRRKRARGQKKWISCPSREVAARTSFAGREGPRAAWRITASRSVRGPPEFWLPMLHDNGWSALAKPRRGRQGRGNATTRATVPVRAGPQKLAPTAAPAVGPDVPGCFRPHQLVVPRRVGPPPPGRSQTPPPPEANSRTRRKTNPPARRKKRNESGARRHHGSTDYGQTIRIAGNTRAG